MQTASALLSHADKIGCLMIGQANLTEDTLQVHLNTSATGAELLAPGIALTSYFRAFADGGYVHPDDVTDFRAYTAPEYLLSFFRRNHGQTIHWMHYRRKEGNDFRWVVMEILPDESYTDENASVVVVIKDVHEAVTNQGANNGSVLRALCGSYDSIYCLDLQRERVVPYRAFSHGVATFDDYIRSNPRYQELIGKYINASVFPADRNHVARITDISFVREYLAVRDSFSAEFRTIYDGEVHWYRINYSRISPDDELRYIALGLSDISDQKRIETDFYRESSMVLIVGRQNSVREQLCAILMEDYPIVTAGTGEAAMEILEARHESIAVVITDQNLPDYSGTQLIQRMKTDHRFRSIPVIVTDEGQVRAEEYICMGASDFIGRPYQPAVLKNRVNFMVRYRESSNMLNILERDPLTALYTKEFFYRSADKIIHENPEKKYAVLLSDIEHFHFFKERYGQKSGDELLKNLASISQELLDGYVIGGRINDDIFAYLLVYSDSIAENVISLQSSVSAVSAGISGISVFIKCGLYVVEEDIPVSTMCDRAILAVKSIKGVYGASLAEFDVTMREQLLKTQQIVENAENGLADEQFIVYYQPKHNLNTGKIGGAEAVIRWNHPILGFMNPVSFVPLFEQNGFIEVLDTFVLRRVCRDFIEFREKNALQLPVSVNISRVDFGKTALADRIIEIVDSYQIDHSMIHLEITESGFAEDPDGVIREISRLHDAGFIIELDDFGTGYSSLSALSSIPVDILKLDMSLLRQGDSLTNRNILEFSMQLAKIMKMQTVQEGVETREQLERMISLGCDQVQGFFFSKPLPKKDFVSYCLKNLA